MTEKLGKDELVDKFLSTHEISNMGTAEDVVKYFAKWADKQKPDTPADADVEEIVRGLDLALHVLEKHNHMLQARAVSRAKQILQQHKPITASVKIMSVNYVIQLINTLSDEQKVELRNQMFPEHKPQGEVDEEIQKIIHDNTWIEGELGHEEVWLNMIGVVKLKQLLQSQKPKVSREWITERAKEFYLGDWKEWEEMLMKLLRRKEIGVRIEE